MADRRCRSNADVWKFISTTTRQQARGPNLMDFQKARDAGLIQKFNPLPAYFDHLHTLINTEIIAENPQRFVVDAMYGAGRGVIKSFLQGTGCDIAEIRSEMNPGFGGIHPEPIAKNFGALSSAVSSGMGNFGLVTDGDADRIGAMDERGTFVDPHKIFALSLKYLVEQRGLKGAVVRTVSTTRMIDRLAKKYGLKLYETPVGFQSHRGLHDAGRCIDRRRRIGRHLVQGTHPRRRWPDHGIVIGRNDRGLEEAAG